MDEGDPANPVLLIAMSDQQYLLKLNPEGREVARIPCRGNPRQIRRSGNHYFVAHLGTTGPGSRLPRIQCPCSTRSSAFSPILREPA